MPGPSHRDDEVGRSAVMVMPDPATLAAPAVWVTASNWARGLHDRFGSVSVCLPGSTLNGADELEPMTRSAPARRGRPPRRGTRDLRVLAKDGILLARRGRDARRYLLPSQPPALVWRHHDVGVTAGRALARRHGVPLVHFVDAPVVWEARLWGVRRPAWGWALERVAELPQLRDADVVACVSSDVADAVADLGVSRQRIVITPCTADPSRFHPSVDGSVVRRRHGLAPDCLVLGWAGSFRRFHGLDQAVEAFARVVAQAPTARLLLVGDGSERARIEGRCHALGIADRVVFTGAVPHAQMPECVAAMDVAVVTAGGNGFHYSPLKLREYLVAGRAVLAPAVGQIADDLVPGTEAWLYPPGDVGALADGMATLAASVKLREQLGRSGRARELRLNSVQAQITAVLDAASGRAPSSFTPGSHAALAGAPPTRRAWVEQNRGGERARR